MQEHSVAILPSTLQLLNSCIIERGRSALEVLILIHLGVATEQDRHRHRSTALCRRFVRLFLLDTALEKSERRKTRCCLWKIKFSLSPSLSSLSHLSHSTLR